MTDAKSKALGRILITRPETDQGQTGKALISLGFEPLYSPVMDIVRCPVQLTDEEWQGVIVTSRNALRALDAVQLEALRHHDLYCVGAQTAALAKALGFASIAQVARDAAELIASLRVMLKSGCGPVLYLAGRHRSGSILQDLEAQKIDVHLLEMYEMVPREHLVEDALIAIKDQRLDGVLLYSKRTSRLFLSLLEKYDLLPSIRFLTFYCLSDAVASPLEAADCRIVVSEEPNETALLACVKKDHTY